MDKKSKILAAAIKSFAQHGYESVSVDEIVEKAGVAKGTFYYYFKSKEDLFLSLIGTGIDHLSEHMALDAGKTTDPVKRVVSIIESQYYYFAKNKDFCRVLVSEIWHFESKWKQKYAPRRDQYIFSMVEAINDGKKLGLFDQKLDSKISATAIFGMVATSALDSVISGDKNSNKAMKMITKIALQGLMAN